ncbi:RCC1 domain-containing protein [Nocardioides sp. TF02-7]|uniref:RCC1 domain-containing protein n=1 Tax=Nocardioides sp. TF02-7 TaxID=2917724 RepID=UPI001F055467|nr:RCC1 domain-containing protein [Nocardioides sp. TF02-7]UMG93789.1 hypothetical protein MF408_06460 [Nocardioides sp. TF02-7]
MFSPSSPHERVRWATASVFLLVGLVTGLLLLPAPSATAEPGENLLDPRAAAALTAGSFHSCALGVTGEVRCWGVNGNGQLGTGNEEPVGDDEAPGDLPPVDLGPGRTARAVSAGGQHTCAILDTGAVRCWGFNASGQLGTGSTDYVGDDEPVADGVDVALGPGRSAVQLAAGGNHTCAVLDNGQLRCWGDNAHGQLGLGSTTALGNDEPVASVPPVYVGAGRTVRAVAAGVDHTCAVLDNGRLRCWGDNSRGQLGLGSTDDHGDDEIVIARSPVDLGARTVTAVAAGERNTCVVLDDGSLRCWGRNNSGELGLGTTTDLGDDEAVTTGGPVYLGPGRTAVAVSLAGSNTCALLDTQQLRCWGDDGNGQLVLPGEETIGDDELPILPTIPLGTDRMVRAAAVGGHDFVCATLDTAQVRCWGRGAYLGLGGSEDVGDDELPTAVAPVATGFAVGRSPAATALSVAASPTRDQKRPYVFTVRGRLTGALVPAACAGRVTVSVTGKARVAGTRTRVAVRGRARVAVTESGDRCRYRARVTVRPGARRLARKALVGRVRATATYGGAPLLRPSKTSVRLRLG